MAARSLARVRASRSGGLKWGYGVVKIGNGREDAANCDVGANARVWGIILSGFVSLILVAASVVVVTPPASAAITTNFGYTCGTDTYRFEASDQFGSSDDMQRFVLGFVVGGVVDSTVASDVSSPAPVILSDNTDALGLGAATLNPGDQVDVYFKKYTSWPVSDAQVLGGTHLGSFAYCGTSTAAKNAMLSSASSAAYSYRNWTGRVSYDCTANALHTRRTHAPTVPSADFLQEVVVHKGRAVLTSGYRTFRAESVFLGPLVPELSPGDQVDVYVAPYEWLMPPTGPIGAFPRTTFAAKLATDPAATRIYSFNYGSCGSLPVSPPVVDQCATTPGVQSSPCPVAMQSKKVKWRKQKGRGLTYKTRISTAGPNRAFSTWRSAGKSRSMTFTNLAPGTYVVQVQAKAKGKSAKRLKSITFVIG